MQQGNSITNEKSHVTNFLMCFSQSSENDLFKNFFNSKIEITVLIFNLYYCMMLISNILNGTQTCIN